MMNFYFKRQILLPFLALLSACGAYQVDEEQDNGQAFQLTTSVKPAEMVSRYGLFAYLFGADNALIEKKEDIVDEQELVFSLGKGDCSLCLFSGLSEEDYIYPIETIPAGMLEFREGNCAPVPLLRAEGHVSLEQNAHLDLSLSYVVAALNVSLRNIPENAQSVTVCVSPVCSGITLSGDYKNDGQTCIVSCRHEDNRWIADPVYLFPSPESTHTTLSVHVQQPEGETIYGYTYNQPLKAGRPYNVSTADDGEVSLDGECQISGWEQAVDIMITPEHTEEKPVSPDDGDDAGSEEETEEVYVTQIPEDETVWGPVYVWKSESVSLYESVLTLISGEQELMIASDAAEWLANYEAEGIKNWRTFTRREAEEFKAQYGSSLDELNDFLSDNGMEKFYKYENERYLCSDTDSTFSLKSNSKIIKAGEKTKYYIRGVKKLKVKLK